MNEHIVTDDARPDRQWAALIEHAEGADRLGMNPPPRGWTDVTNQDVSDLIDRLNDGALGKYGWNEYGQVVFIPAPTRTIVASRLEPVWERCTYYIEVPADMALPLMDEEDPRSGVDVDALLDLVTLSVRVDACVFDSMAGADPSDWRIIDMGEPQ